MKNSINMKQAGEMLYNLGKIIDNSNFPVCQTDVYTAIDIDTFDSNIILYRGSDEDIIVNRVNDRLLKISHLSSSMDNIIVFNGYNTKCSTGDGFNYIEVGDDETVETYQTQEGKYMCVKCIKDGNEIFKTISVNGRYPDGRRHTFTERYTEEHTGDDFSIINHEVIQNPKSAIGCTDRYLKDSFGIFSSKDIVSKDENTKISIDSNDKTNVTIRSFIQRCARTDIVHILGMLEYNDGGEIKLTVDEGVVTTLYDHIVIQKDIKGSELTLCYIQ